MQTKFGIVIFSVGLMIAATVLHRTVIEGREFGTFNTMSIIVGFAVAAPLLFVAPMVSFTGRLRRVRSAGIHKYAEEASRRLWVYEESFPPHAACERQTARRLQDVPAMQDLAICYSNVAVMRIMPLDFRSMMELLGWALGPMLPPCRSSFPGRRHARWSPKCSVEPSR